MKRKWEESCEPQALHCLLGLGLEPPYAAQVGVRRRPQPQPARPRRERMADVLRAGHCLRLQQQPGRRAQPPTLGRREGGDALGGQGSDSLFLRSIFTNPRGGGKGGHPPL